MLSQYNVRGYIPSSITHDSDSKPDWNYLHRIRVRRSQCSHWGTLSNPNSEYRTKRDMHSREFRGNRSSELCILGKLVASSAVRFSGSSWTGQSHCIQLSLRGHQGKKTQWNWISPMKVMSEMFVLSTEKTTFLRKFLLVSQAQKRQPILSGLNSKNTSSCSC